MKQRRLPRLLARFLLLVGAATALSGTAARADDIPTTPSAGPSRSIGAAANGCLAGAQPMPLTGPGWEILRPTRNRFWGTPALLAFLHDLSSRTAPLGWLQIGDMSLPRGGHMPTGHSSHQTGVDVDVFFQLADAPLSDEERATPEVPSMVRPDGTLNPALWGERQVTMLSTFAKDPRVERIFVNPHIKRALCDSLTQDRDWLRKLRPWWGHDDHFHVRITCPADSPACLPGPSIPEGDGCGAELNWWFSDEALHPKPKAPEAKPSPPEICKEIWAE